MSRARWGCLAVGVVALGCVDGLAPTSSLSVITSTTANDADLDGYSVTLDAERREAIGTRDTLLVDGLSSGEHIVRLEGVDPHCSVTGDVERRVVLEARGAAEIHFDVSCGRGNGALQISTLTRGRDLDPSGYLIELEPGRTIALSDTVATSAAVPSGRYDVLLEDVAPNCKVDGENPRAVTVPVTGAAFVRFEVECSATQPAGRGREIAFIRAANDDPRLQLGQLYLMNDDGTSVRAAATIVGLSARVPDWLADGSHLGLLMNEDECDQDCDMTYLLDVASGVAQVVSSARRRLGRPRWSPDGGHLTRSTAGFCEDDEQCFESVAIESADHEEFSSFSSDSLRYLSPDWLPSGNGVAFVREGTYLLDIATRALDDLEDTPVSGNLAGRLSNVSDLAVSFDGTQVAFSAEPLPADGSSQIYVTRFGEGEPEPVTSGQYENTSPSWAPDGSRLAFVSNRDGNTNIYVVDLGTRMATRVTSDPHPEYSPTWRP